MKINQAYAMGKCRECGFAGRLRFEHKPCDYHRLPSLNYLGIEKDECARMAIADKRKGEKP
jgi:hypothetical protein